MIVICQVAIIFIIEPFYGTLITDVILAIFTNVPEHFLSIFKGLVSLFCEATFT